VIAQLGNPDMRTPIAYGLSYPERIESGAEPLNFAQLADFSFTKPDVKRYPNLFLAIEACKQGQSSTTVLNAANEVAVQAFLEAKISFLDIARINQETLQQLEHIELDSIAQVIEHDSLARRTANTILGKLL
jgi:1-deoxy-D-xylulose-5-phosphate reductoisomerase